MKLLGIFSRNCLLLAALLLLVSAAGLTARDDAKARAADPFCSPSSLQVGEVKPGTARMIGRLAALRARVSAVDSPYLLNADVVRMLRQDLAEAQSPEMGARIRFRLAGQLLSLGHSEEALQEYERFLAEAVRLRLPSTPEERDEFTISRILSHLRLGEQENCVLNHSSDSCLFPIREWGVHKLQRGSRGAIRLLEDQLNRVPGDLRSRWLLNIAYMTLGEYPAGVPRPWLIPPAVFESDHDIKRFPDVAGQAGLDASGVSGGGITEDFDGDGLLDVMVSRMDWEGQLRLFRNNGNGSFTERTGAAGLAGLTGGLNILQADYNNDGFPDVLVLRGAWLGNAGRIPNSLLKNNGDGTFEDVTDTAGLTGLHPTQTAAWFDYNGDGQVDLFIGNESFEEDINPCELYRNNGDGTFTECAREAGVAVTLDIKGVASGDYNNDGRPDLYLSNRDGANLLFRNEGAQAGGRWRFTDVAREAGVQLPGNSFPTWFFDYDNDGWEDIFVAGYGVDGVGDIAADYLGLPNNCEKPKLYRNSGDGTFTDVTADARLNKVMYAMGVNFGDLDNDGWLDFYVGTGDPSYATLIPNRMFRNAGGQHFQEVTTSGNFGHLQKGHGVSFGDLDNDGDQDVHIVMGGALLGDVYRNALFQNPGHGNRWITLKLEGGQSNRGAIGARIRVVVDTGAGERSIYKTVGTGGSFGASPLRQEIGLGQAKSIQRVEIQWPAMGRTQTLRGLDMDRFYKVREDSEIAVEWVLPAFRLGGQDVTGVGPGTQTATSAE